MSARRILLVEDDRFLRRAVEAALARAGFEVLVAADAEQAPGLARAGRPDLVLLDVVMPRVSGFEVLEQLKGDPATAPIPVIMLTNLSQDGDVARARASGAAGYLVKASLSLKELVRQVEEALAVV